RRLDALESRDERECKARTPGAALGHDDAAEPQLPHQPLPVLTGLDGNEHRPRTTCDGVAVRLEAERQLVCGVARAVRDADHGVLAHTQESARGRRRYTCSYRFSRMRIRAAVLEEFGQPLVVQEVDLAEPRAGEVLVRLAACGVCHTDLYTASGVD